MYYVMEVNSDKTVTCHLGTSHEFAAYAKKSRLQKHNTTCAYRQIEIVWRE